MPGTKFYELVHEQLRDKTHWRDSDDLAMMFHGAYTSEFYREVRNLLHEQVSRGTYGDESRWQQLMSRERDYRSPDRQAAALG